MKYLLLFLGLICFQSSQAQFWKRKQTDSTATDSTKLIKREDFIKSHPDHFFIWPVLKQRMQNYELHASKPDKRTIGYYSNKPFSLGIGFYMFEVSAEIAFAIPLKEKKRAIYGESDATNLVANVLGKKWGVEAFWQRYQGFYLKDSHVNVPSNTPYIQRPDIMTRNIGVNVNYIFNNKKFSFRAAYNYSERQLKSGGSFILYGSVDHFRIEGDSALLGNSFDESFLRASRVKKFDSFIIGVEPGYTYSLIHNGFYINGMLVVGPVFNSLTYKMTGNEYGNSNQITPLVALRVAVGYNGERFFGGMSFSSQSSNTKFENVDLTSSVASFKILAGYRMLERGILKKRARDLEDEILR
jgi:hypothetical protein